MVKQKTAKEHGGDAQVHGPLREAHEEDKVDQEAQTQHLLVEAVGVDAGGDAGAEAGQQHVGGAEQVGARHGHDQVSGF